MALARTLSVGLLGLEGHLVEVEAYLAAGLPGLTMVGLPDAALSESRDRIKAALVNSGEIWPTRRITIGLSPASLRKRGAGFDLAIAAAILSAAGVVPVDRLAGTVLLGELGLDGRVRPMPGVLPSVLAAVATGIDRVVVPAANVREASLVPGLAVVGVGSLRGLLAHLRGEEPPLEEPVPEPPVPVDPQRGGDLSDVVGQSLAKWGLEIAAAGGHHLYLHGPPGAGKTMLAERLAGLLPPLEPAAALEVTAVHSVAGLLRPGAPLVTRPPFAAPHHSASVPAIIGGGAGLARPGAASVAHRGVLFLDEAPEFPGGCLDALRQPLESGEVVLARSAGTVRYPARFLLVLAANPCPCSSAGTPACSCPPSVRLRYTARLSGPLLDRIDLTVQVDRPSRHDLLAQRRFAESSAVVAERVHAARRLAAEVFRDVPWRLPAELPGRELRDGFAPAPGSLGVVDRLLRTGALSARGLDRVLRVAWTVALLRGARRPTAEDVDRAAGLRLGAAA